MKRFIVALLTSATAVFAVNPNTPEAQKKLSQYLEPLPSPDVRKVLLESRQIRVINTKANYWTVLVLPFEDFEYLVGNSSIYEVRKLKNKLLIRPKKTFVNSDLTVIRDGQIYKFLLSQSRQLPDLVVEAVFPEKVNYSKEVEAFLRGENPENLKHIRVEPFREGRDYDTVVEFKGRKWGIRYDR